VLRLFYLGHIEVAFGEDLSLEEVRKEFWRKICLHSSFARFGRKKPASKTNSWISSIVILSKLKEPRLKLLNNGYPNNLSLVSLRGQGDFTFQRICNLQRKHHIFHCSLGFLVFRNLSFQEPYSQAYHILSS